MKSELAIDAQGLMKSFGTITALDGVTLSVPLGTVMALAVDNIGSSFRCNRGFAVGNYLLAI